MPDLLQAYEQFAAAYPDVRLQATLRARRHVYAITASRSGKSFFFVECDRAPIGMGFVPCGLFANAIERSASFIVWMNFQAFSISTHAISSASLYEAAVGGIKMRFFTMPIGKRIIPVEIKPSSPDDLPESIRDHPRARQLVTEFETAIQ